MKTTVSYRVKKRNGNELYAQGTNFLSNLGDSLSWLNSQFGRNYDEMYSEDAIFEWEIAGTEIFSGKLLLNNQSFLEQIIKINLEEFKR